MGIDEVSERLGVLTKGMEDLNTAFRDHVDEDNEAHEGIDDKLDALIAKGNYQEGVLARAKRTAQIWGAVIGAVVVATLEFLKHQFFGA